MARYWVYLNAQVKGPYELEQLIRIPGFSRQTLVSVDDYSGTVGKWISPAEIPELARIFQKVDELHDTPPPAARPVPKPARPKIPLKLTPVPPPLVEVHPWYKNGWLWFLLLLLLGGAAGAVRWTQMRQRAQFSADRKAAQVLIETAPLPPSSHYSSIRQYLQMKQIASRWEFLRLPTGLYNVTLSWFPAEKTDQMPVYAFEVNLQVNSVRGVNSAAERLLSEGFRGSAKPPSPAAPTAPGEPTPRKKSPGDNFPSALNDRRQAFEQGDFEAVWDSFSKRRQDEMQQGGIGRTGFIRMQKMTFKSSAGLQQTILKTRSDTETSRLVLLRQSQPKHPDIYIKQRWVWENEAWRLDDEEKKIAAAVTSGGSSPADESLPPASTGSSPAEEIAQPESKKPDKAPVPRSAIPPNLPGLSDSSANPR